MPMSAGSSVVRSRVRQRWILGVVTLVAALTAIVSPSARAHDWDNDGFDDDVIIDNSAVGGHVRLGLHPEGHLNVCIGDSCRGTGLQYIPTDAEATAPGCYCEGWGVAAADLMTAGYANESADFGAVNLRVTNFTSDGTSAVSRVEVDHTGTDVEDGGGGGGEDEGGGPAALVAPGEPLFEVIHDFHPSASPNLYEVTVTITNVSDTDVNDLRYRRVMDWDIEPTPFAEFVTIEGSSDALLFSSNDGFASANPLSGHTSGGEIGPGSLGGGGPFVDSGPNDHGALFDFGFGALPAGQTKSFNIYYGAAGTENAALVAIDFVGATLYSLGQPSTLTGAANGDPNTFIFAFGAVGGDPLERISVRKRADHPETLAGGTNGYSIAIVNPTPGPMTVDKVIDDLPDGFSYVLGSSTFNGAAIDEPVISASPGGDGDRLEWTGPITVASTTQGILHFDVSVSPTQAVGVYRNTATAEARNAAGDPVAVRSSGPAAPVTVPPPDVADDIDATSATGTTTARPDGTVEISMGWGSRSDITITARVECPTPLGGTPPTFPTGVSFEHNGVTYGALPTSEELVYQATIPGANLAAGPINVVAVCPPTGEVIANPVAFVVLFDPSGIITDALTGAPIVGARVTLYKVPFAQPDTDDETRQCRTVETRIGGVGGTWDDEPDATAGAGEVYDTSFDPAEIDPNTNPLHTDATGFYGWDVAQGCWFVKVEASGYATRFSPIVGVPPEVTDLDLALEPTGPVDGLPGRFTGNGKVGTAHVKGIRLDCRPAPGRRQKLVVTWGKNKFELTSISSSFCSNDPTIVPKKKGAETHVDTYDGSGTGTYNKVAGATVTIRVQDAGVPGKGRDRIRLLIKNADGTTVLDIDGAINSGNVQAHP